MDGGGDALRELCHDVVTPAVLIGHLAHLIELDGDAPANVRSSMARIAGESLRFSEIRAFNLGSVRRGYGEPNVDGGGGGLGERRA